MGKLTWGRKESFLRKAFQAEMLLEKSFPPTYLYDFYFLCCNAKDKALEKVGRLRIMDRTRN